MWGFDTLGLPHYGAFDILVCQIPPLLPHISPRGGWWGYTLIGALIPFLCFINDLLDGIPSKVKLYVDDVQLNATIHTERLGLSKLPHGHLDTWAEEWKMTFNYCKFH